VVQDEEFAEAGGGSRLTFYLDGAHTPESMAAAAHWFADAAAADADAGGGGGGGGAAASSSGVAAAAAAAAAAAPQRGSAPVQSWAALQGGGGGSGGAASHNVLMFNCMKERDPGALLPALAGSLAQRGLGMGAAVFVPPDSQYAFLPSSKSSGRIAEINADVSWQGSLRDVWERCGGPGGGAGGATAAGGESVGALRLALPALPGGNGVRGPRQAGTAGLLPPVVPLLDRLLPGASVLCVCSQLRLTAAVLAPQHPHS
jgi:hypothetical protein